MKSDKDIPRGGNPPLCTGLIPDVLPEVGNNGVASNSHTGVSTNSTPSADTKHWYVLRTTYGREKKAYDYLVAKNVKAFYPTLQTVRIVNGKRREMMVSRIPNLFFAFGTEDEIKSFVYDNVNLPFLRFYYQYFSVNGKKEKTPMIIPEKQMETLRIICGSDDDNIILSTDELATNRFKKGQLVRVIDGKFKGVVGVVAKHKGQQRVGIVVDGLLTAMTAYVPSLFLECIVEEKM